MMPDAAPDAPTPARRRWISNMRWIAALLGVWFVVTFVVAFFARDLSMRIFGWPFAYWVAGQGAPSSMCWSPCCMHGAPTGSPMLRRGKPAQRRRMRARVHRPFDLMRRSSPGRLPAIAHICVYTPMKTPCSAGVRVRTQ